jgi:hypothetical protein
LPEPAWRTDTVQCTTGHCLVHHRTVRCTQTAQSLGCSAKSFPNWSFPVSSTWTQYISLQNNVLSLRNIPLLLICTLSIIWHRLTHDHLCWHSITKILRNGPKADFPFTCPYIQTNIEIILYPFALSHWLFNLVLNLCSLSLYTIQVCSCDTRFAKKRSWRLFFLFLFFSFG